MLYLDNIVMHNFKSFRHSSIKLKNGYNCIVGPNGSGKSNICDSILFALGETSLKRLRVTKTGHLINGAAKPMGDDGVKRAYVKLFFTGDNKSLEVSRIIKSNNKIGYRLDGKKASKQEVVDALRSYGIIAGETNTIAQGEITYLQSLNPRERRELIDAAAGIKEFDEKRITSLKELEKVDNRVREAQIELDMKKGFLSEIEKQKDDAEKYLTLKDYSTRGAYTILKSREGEVSAQYDTFTGNIRVIEGKISKINGRLLELEAEIGKLSADKAAFSKQLNEKSIESSATNRRLEEIEKEVAVKDSQSKSIKERVVEREVKIDSNVKELGALKELLEKAQSELDGANKELKGKNASADLGKLEELAASNSDTQSMLDTYNDNQNKIYSLQEKVSSLSSSLLKLDIEIEKDTKEIAEIRAQTGSSENQGKGKAQESVKDRFEKVTREKSEIKKKMDSYSKEASRQRDHIGEIDLKMFELKEQIAMSGGSHETRLEDELKAKLGQRFYGKAFQLCTYEEKYDAAVNAAGGGRLNYFVVDSAETASEGISLMKSRQLGRASFIPINDIVVRNADKTETGLTPIISHVKFEKRFEKAFRYIFSDTYLVESIEQAKRSGFGRNRFVTFDGELIEQHGVITGGAIKRQANIRGIQLKVTQMSKEREELGTSMSGMIAESDALREKLSLFEAEELRLNFEMRSSRELIETERARSEQLRAKAKELEKLVQRNADAKTEIEKERTELSGALEALKTENESIFEKTRRASDKPKASREKEIAKYRAIRDEIERLNVRAAELTKENGMRTARSEQLESEIGTVKGQIKEDRSRLAILDSEMMELANAKGELQEEIKSHGKSYSSIITKMRDLDEQLSRRAEERGKNTSELSRTERDMVEANTKMVQMQTRLADIKAELASYQNVEPIIGEEIRTIESKVASAKLDMERLGMVNLKAPEVYKEKQKEVVEAVAKVSTLSNEKESILNMIKEIDAKKLSVFKETFNQVNDNFKRLHSYVFETPAHLDLDNPKDPLTSGLNIVIAGGRNKNIFTEQFSGGEKTLLVLMLIFSIQIRNPLSFYLFDEIDTSLDKENTKKLSKLIGELSKSSQMIVVSHNDIMITAADTALGVVRRGGESVVVGVQMASTSDGPTG